ncbi:tRNA (cytidine(34)-2'-O)-methyltransferase [Alphaproteobacteria bacterium]|nr:tRNA (cytidine(34)-2'-O)-methyltransferase [Alphaproteobacteria bacterium]
MFQIVLFNPEIPPNTGNILRLAANTGSTLHLIKPLGFDMNNNSLKRAGMDYKKDADFFIHDDIQSCLDKIEINEIYALTKFADKAYTKVQFKKNDCLVFGSETSGLPDFVLEKIKKRNRLRIPMAQGSRSLNLSNAVAIVTYEALRQNSFHNLL